MTPTPLGVVYAALKDSHGTIKNEKVLRIERLATPDELQEYPEWGISTYRTISEGRPYLRFPIELSLDDFGKAKRGKWSPLLAMYYSICNLNRSEGYMPVNTKCFGISGSKTPFVDSLRTLKNELAKVKDGFFTYCKALNQVVFVESPLNLLVSDNSMASKICCHKGAMTKFYCRKCFATKDDPSLEYDLREQLEIQNTSDLDLQDKGLSR
jgi:hypothetical protein